MKILITNYSFNRTAKTITFNDYSSINKENILAVINTTSAVTIYRPDVLTIGGAVSTNVLTLTYDTSAMNDTDDLLIYYDDENAYIGRVGAAVSSASFTYTRPANTTAYAAGDVISATSATNMSFQLARINGGSGEINKVLLVTDQATNNSGYKILWYSTNITALADNAQNTLLYANRDSFIGTTFLNAVSGETGTNTGVFSMNDYDRLQFNCGSSSREIFGVLVTLDGFTPASGQLFFVKVWANLD